MANPYPDSILEGYLEEALPHDQMIAIEEALRSDSALGERLADVVGKMDAGVHTVGSIWRRERLSCPSREKLGSYLLNVLDAEETDYIRFHLNTVGCRLCNASLVDLRQQHETGDADAQATRRTRYFQSSAGYLSADD